MSYPSHDELAALNARDEQDFVNAEARADERELVDLSVNEDTHGAPLPSEYTPVDTRTAEANLAGRSNIVAG